MLDKLQGLAGTLRLAPEKRAALNQLLAPLGADTAAKIARGIELQRLNEPEKLPYSDILDSIRPQLRKTRPPRTPTVLRLVCDGFEEFLINQRHGDKRLGEIPRSTIPILWTVLQSGKDADRLNRLAGELATLVKAGDADEIDIFGRGVRETAANMLTDIIADWPHDGRRPKLNALGRALSDEEIADIKEIATVLAIADPIDTTMSAIEEASPLDEEQLRHRLLRLNETMVNIAKAAYLDLSSRVGGDAKYLALSLMGRLENPAEILALPRALAMNRRDWVMQDSELAILGERLLEAIEIDAKRLGRLASDCEPDGSNFETVGDEATTLLARLQAQFLGMTTEIDIRRGGPWGERLLKMRRMVSSAMDDTLIEAAMSSLLVAAAFDEEYPDPSKEELEALEQAEQFLLIALRVADTLGFGGIIRPALREFQKQLDHQVDLISRAMKGLKDDAVYQSARRARARASEIRTRLWPEDK